MNNKTRVLHIITDLPIGGAQDNTLYTLELLNRNKYEVFFACNMSGEYVDRALAIEYCEIYDIKSMQRDVNPLRDIKTLIELTKLIRKEKFDIVHTHSTKPGVIGRFAAFIAGTPIIVHTVHGFPFHDYMNPVKRQVYIMIEKIMNFISTHLITVSTLNLKKIVDLGMAPAEKITNIYSGIDVDRFGKGTKKDLHKELNLPDGTKLIGFIGRFSEQKSPLTFLEAIVQVVKEVKNCHFIFVGDGPKKNEMVAFAKEHKIDSFMSYLGYRHDVHEILHGLDLFALSSIYEGLGRSLTEALCCKIPVVATAVEGVPELVRHKVTGLLVEPRSPKEFAESLVFALNNPLEMQMMAEAGYLFVKDNFQVSDMVANIDVLYSELLDS